jgi:tetratricopeptide (TPR) repeat protein
MADRPALAKSVFISCVSEEFENPGGRYPGLRTDLDRYLRPAQCDVCVQEILPQMPVDTIEKLDSRIRDCAAVIHVVGEKSGAIANVDAVRAYLDAEPSFLASRPELKTALGDLSDLTYTQWEAFIALHRNIPLFVYASDGASAQRTHLDRLRLGRRHESAFRDPADLFGQLIGDLHVIIPTLPPRPVIAPSRILRHSPEHLFGREQWLDELDEIWNARPSVNVFALIAWGGAGKTSVVAHWVAKRLAARGWPGVERYFDWSFYSQGTREQSQASGDFFIAEALKFFGDPDPQAGSPWDRGQRLAGLVRRHRTLLVLDGIEPLQYPPNSPQAGELKDQALAALLLGLAADNPGLCIVTSREALKNLETFHGGTVDERKLEKLTKEAAISLLRHLQISGTDEEMEEAWHDAGGHALTISLLGRFLADAHGGDIRHRHDVHLEEADRETPGRTAMKVLLAYEKWLESAGPERQRDLAVLRLMGFFDRPATADCLAALRARKPPGVWQRLLSSKMRQIHRIFGPLTAITDAQWQTALNDLAELDLITLSHVDSIDHTEVTVDAHPLVREYFAQQLKGRSPAAFRAGHSRLFDHLCNATEHQPDTLAGLHPLYQAVVHGCLAGRQQEAREKVYRDRILRGTGSGGNYSTFQLGAVSADLGAVVAFFDEPWSRLSANLSAPDQAWLLNEAAFSLRALGRLTEAVEPMQVSLKQFADAQDWRQAAVAASNLSELEVTLGRLGQAVADGRRAIELADRSGDAFQKMARRTTAADALHQAGERAEAGELFAAAERMQAERQPQFPLLYSVGGSRFADLLLAPAERAACRAVLNHLEPGQETAPVVSDNTEEALKACGKAEQRAQEVFRWRRGTVWNPAGDALLDIAHDHLTLARARLYRALLSAAPAAASAGLAAEVSTALAKLRESNNLDDLPKALLTAALHAGALAQQPKEARLLLDEAQMIAERGPMPLYLADVHLHRARLFRDRAELAKARALIEKHGYWRRREELEDAEEAFSNASQP